jgi:hypothetical protein
MAIIAFALPILPGQSGSAGNFAGELDAAGLRSRYEELNRAADLKQHLEWVQHSPDGDLLIIVFETDAPQKLGREFSDDEYDNWWRARVQRIHGFDPAVGGHDPDLKFAWSADR